MNLRCRWGFHKRGRRIDVALIFRGMAWYECARCHETVLLGRPPEELQK